jgi:predicted nucleic acid-binding protein
MLYLDTSVLIALFVREVASDDVASWFAALPMSEVTTSEWTRVEFASAVGLRVRTASLEREFAADIVGRFARLAERSVAMIVPEKEDFALSSMYLQRFDLGLRAGDALHLAIASRRGCERIYSLDQKLVRSAARLKIRAGQPEST